MPTRPNCESDKYLNIRKQYRDFYESNARYGAQHCDLEISQWGVGSDIFREEHGKEMTNAIINVVKRQDGRILDVGCGQGHILSKTLEFEEVIGIDISRTRVFQSIKRLKEKGGNFSVFLADAESLPFKDGFFDFVSSTEVIEHVVSDTQMLREILRVLKTDGLLILTTPNAWNFDRICFFVFCLVKGRLVRLSKDSPENILIFEHIRYFNMFILRKRLKEVGFGMLRIKGIGLIPPPTIYRCLRTCPRLRLFARVLQLLGRLFPIFSQTLIAVANKPSHSPPTDSLSAAIKRPQLLADIGTVTRDKVARAACQM